MRCVGMWWAGRCIFRTREEGDEGEAAARTVAVGGLAVGMRAGTYKLVYENGSGDCLWHWRGGEEAAEVERRRRLRLEESKKWIGLS